MKKNLRVGDRIYFRAPTRWADRAVWRVVNGFALRRKTPTSLVEPWPTVRYGGHSEFLVRPHEILNTEHRS